MDTSVRSSATACLAAAALVWLAPAHSAEAPAVAAKATEAPQGEGVVSKVEARATVTSIDHKTRAVTLRREDGKETSFVASEDVRNLDQVKVGDVVNVQYMEALVYEVHKGGAATDGSSTIAGGRAEPGQTPGGVVAAQHSVTVLITAIDRNAPSVTFKTASGETQTFKVRRPERLQGVSVGDTVTLTYTEALAIKLEKPSTP